MRMDRSAELAVIASFIEVRGVTACPPRFVGAVDGVVSQAEAAARLARMPAPRPMTHEEKVRFVRALLIPRPGR
jgi:hypothetical protein